MNLTRAIQLYLLHRQKTDAARLLQTDCSSTCALLVPAGSSGLALAADKSSICRGEKQSDLPFPSNTNAERSAGWLHANLQSSNLSFSFFTTPLSSRFPSLYNHHHLLASLPLPSLSPPPKSHGSSH